MTAVGHADKVLARVLSGDQDAAIHLVDLRALLRRLGFTERQQGGHRVFRHAELAIRLNLQREGSHAKPYQVRQVRRALIEHGLADLDRGPCAAGEGEEAPALDAAAALLGQAVDGAPPREIHGE